MGVGARQFAVFYKMVGMGLIEKVQFESRLGRGKEISQMSIWGKTTPGGKNKGIARRPKWLKQSDGGSDEAKLCRVL